MTNTSLNHWCNSVINTPKALILQLGEENKWDISHTTKKKSPVKIKTIQSLRYLVMMMTMTAILCLETMIVMLRKKEVKNQVIMGVDLMNKRSGKNKIIKWCKINFWGLVRRLRFKLNLQLRKTNFPTYLDIRYLMVTDLRI